MQQGNSRLDQAGKGCCVLWIAKIIEAMYAHTTEKPSEREARYF